jgi:hypothetical protein
VVILFIDNHSESVRVALAGLVEWETMDFMLKEHANKLQNLAEKPARRHKKWFGECTGHTRAPAARALYLQLSSKGKEIASPL